MKRSIIVAVLGFTFFDCAQGNGQARPRDEVETHYSAAYDQCLKTGDAANGVTSAMVNCILAENRQQDRQLNETYRATLARLTPEGRTSLQQSERKWIADRTTKCDATYQQTGGTLDQILGASCILRETTIRRLWLERYPS